MKKHLLQSIETLLCSSIGLLAIFTLSRIVLAILYSAFGNWEDLFLGGFRIDLSTIGYISCAEILLVFFVMISRKAELFFRPILCGFLFVVFGIALFMELVTPSFVGEYGVRPNRLFFEYLQYPKEVFSMLTTGRLTECLILILIMIPSLVFLYFIARKISRLPNCRSGLCTSLIFLLTMTPILVLAARGSLGHRPINPASVATSQSATENEIALNSSYSLIYAITRLGENKSSPELYGFNDLGTYLETVRTDGSTHRKNYINIKELPLAYYLEPTVRPEKPLNVVVILMESQGAQFSAKLNKNSGNYTPELDRLSEQGWMFERMFATGTRSIRGIEAVYGSFPPTSVMGVVKRDRPEHGFVTLGDIYSKLGYETTFFYGGESHFDNMKSYFLLNGIQKVIHLKDYKDEEISFTGVWGICDEDLYTKAFKYMQEKNAQGKPFFSLIFTSSNHEPFEIPADKIKPFNKDLKRESAVQYADYALGKFINQVKSSELFENTVFLIVADHDARAESTNLIPIENSHIPAVFLGAGIQPRKDHRIVSQVDLAPTLLSLTGVRAIVPFIGSDLTIPENGNRALFQYFNNFSYITDEPDGHSLKLTIALPGGKITGLNYNSENKIFTDEEVSSQLSDLTKAYSTIGEFIYRNEFYRADVLDKGVELQLRSNDLNN